MGRFAGPVVFLAPARFLGRLTPYVPRWTFPRLVRLSPFPMHHLLVRSHSEHKAAYKTELARCELAGVYVGLMPGSPAGVH